MRSKPILPAERIYYSLPLRGVKVSTNKIYAGIHWTKRKYIKDSIYSLAGGFCRPIKVVQSYPVEIFYKFVFETKPLDSLNTAFMAKCIEDSFRSLGILEDDDIKHVKRTILEVCKSDESERSKAYDDSGSKIDEENEDRVEIEIRSIIKS